MQNVNVLQEATVCSVRQAWLCELLLAHCPLSDNVTDGIVLLTVMHVGLLWTCFLSALYSTDISGCRKIFIVET